MGDAPPPKKKQKKTELLNEKWQPKNGFNDSGVNHFP